MPISCSCSTRSRWASKLSAAAFAVAGIFADYDAEASTWTFSGSGTWQTATNWLGGVPTASTSAAFNNSGSYTVTSNANAAAAFLSADGGSIGLNSTGYTLTVAGTTSLSAATNLVLTGGTLSTATLVASGAFQIATGTLSLTGTADVLIQSGGPLRNLGTFTTGKSLVTAGNLLVGQSTDGLINVNGGGIYVNKNVGGFALGYTNGGTATLSAGTINAFYDIDIGLVGNGRLTQTGGTLIAGHTLYVGESTGGVGTYSLSGGSATAPTLSLGVGNAVGTINLTGGSIAIAGTTKVFNAASKIYLAGGLLSTATLDLGGDANRIDFSAGTLNITGSANFNVSAGQMLGGNVSLGAGKTLITAGNFFVGSGGAGTINVNGGAVYTNNPAGGLVIGYASLGVGTLSAGTLSAAYDIDLGYFTNGTLTQTGGKLVAGHTLYVGENEGAATYNLSGGSAAAGNLSLGVSGATGTVNLSGGSINVTGLTKIFSADSRLNITGGTLTTGSLDTSAGSLDFTDGTIVINGGTYTPKQTSLSLRYGDLSNWSVGYTNSHLISSAPGSSSRPVVSLLAGGTLSLTQSGTSNSNWIFIGANGGKGGATVDGAGSKLQAAPTQGELSVGAGGMTINSIYYPSDGSLSVTNGGQVSAYDEVVIGGHGGIGRVNVDGTGSKIDAAKAGFRLGFYAFGSIQTPSEGTLTITNGGRAETTNGNVYVGYYGGIGRIVVEGTNSSLSGKYIDVGYGRQGIGTLAVSNGGQVSCFTALEIGASGGVGTVTIDGLDSKLSGNGSLLVGRTQYSDDDRSEGTLTISNGGQVSRSSITIGSEGGRGRVSVSGANSKLLSTMGVLVVGNDRFSVDDQPGTDGDGALAVSGGGFVEASSITVGFRGGVGVASVDGNNSKLSSISSLSIGSDSKGGYPADGTLLLTNGGRASGVTTLIGTRRGRGLVSVGKVDGTDAGGTQLTAFSLNVGSLSGLTATADAGGRLNVYAGGVAEVVNGVIVYANTINAAANQINVLGGRLSAGSMSNAASISVSAGTLSTGAIIGTGSLGASGGLIRATSITQTALAVAGVASIDLADAAVSSVASVVGTINFAGAGRLDLSNNVLVVNYAAASPYANVRDAAAGGYNGGALDGVGLVSQTAAGNAAVAVVEATDLYATFPQTFGGVSIDSTTLLVVPTVAGDANLDRTVDTRDFARLITGFGGTAKWWAGDFNYSGAVNSLDFNVFVANYGKTFVFAGALPSPGATVPEPAAGLVVAAMAMLGLRGRRRMRDTSSPAQRV